MPTEWRDPGAMSHTMLCQGVRPKRRPKNKSRPRDALACGYGLPRAFPPQTAPLTAEERAQRQNKRQRADFRFAEGPRGDSGATKKAGCVLHKWSALM